jgi:hypothetical protein
MRTFIKLAVFVLVAASFVKPAQAATPNLSINRESGDNYRITVNNANSYSQVTLSRRQTTQLWTVISNYGQTDGSGYFSNLENIGSDGTNNVIEYYVAVGGLQSSIVQTYPGSGGGCTYNCGNNNLSLSQTNVSLNVGQNTTVTAYNYSNSLFVSNNTNSNVATVSINGSSINIYGQNTGTTNITVCSNSFSQCATIYVTVGNSGGCTYNCGSFSLSQTNVSMNVGQNVTVTANNYTGSLYVGSNSNSNVATVNVYGSNITLYGQSSGSSTRTICASNTNQCVSIYVTVSGTNTGNITFSQNFVSLNLSESKTIYVYNNGSFGNSYYVSSNTNPNVVTVSQSGSSLNLYGQSVGNSNITVCLSSSNSSCGTLYVTVGGGTNGNLTFSQNNPSLNANQTMYISIYGANNNVSFYVQNNTNSNVASASIAGSSLYLQGLNQGSTQVTVCQTSSSNCGSVFVTVSGGSSGGNLYFTSLNLPQPTVGQYYSQQLQASGGTTPYTYTLASGNLPSGLSLSGNGQIFGTPQNNQSAYFVVRVSDYYGRTQTASLTLTPSGVLGGSTYRNGQLISENGTVYIVYKNSKSGFVSRAVFEGFGFSFGQVVNTGFTGIPSSGYIIGTSNTSHPWGSWVKSGSTVYFVHESGLIPVPDYFTFQNNGGEDRLVVAANTYDFRLPQLSVMVANDARLR